MNQLTSAFILVLMMTLSACSKDAATKTNFDQGRDINPSQIKNIDLKKPAVIVDASTKPLEDGIVVSILAPSINTNETKEILLNQFSRTLEFTLLNLKIKVMNPNLLGEATTFTLLNQGFIVDEQKVNLTADQNTLNLNFRTPRLSNQGQEDGVENAAYELLISNNNRNTHLPFSFKIYSAKNSTLIVPQDATCSIYYKPEPASGCLQNRTRTTQEVVFNDDKTIGNDRNITVSGGITLGIGIVSAQLGGQGSTTNSQSTSQGSEIHFTNCIECSSIVFRQVVETIRKGDVYKVLADGSLQWVGDVNYSTKAYSYEFSSTGSESKNYNCSFESLLPVGRTETCDEIAKP